jgi:hypothetical protein
VRKAEKIAEGSVVEAVLALYPSSRTLCTSILHRKTELPEIFKKL